MQEDLNKKGDFGLGVFDEIDGVMVALDGKFYQGTLVVFYLYPLLHKKSPLLQ